MLTSNELMYKLPKTQKKRPEQETGQLHSGERVLGSQPKASQPKASLPLCVNGRCFILIFTSQGLLKLFLKLVLKLNIEMVHSVALKTKHKKKTKS